MSSIGKILGLAFQIVVMVGASLLFPGSGIALFIGSMIGAIGGALITQALTPKQAGTRPEAGKINVRISEPIRWINAGECRQGGAVMFAEFDASGNLWYLVIHSDSFFTGNPVYYFDDLPVTVNLADGSVLTKDFRLSGKKKDIVTADGNGETHMWVWTATYTEANPVPSRIAAFDAAFPGMWTTDHKLVGTTYSVVKMAALAVENRYKLYKWRGALGLGEPAISIVGQFSMPYDPALLYNHYTRNAVLIWAWFRTHRYGRNKPSTSINWTKIAEQAAICDETVTGISGSQPRYRCDVSAAEDRTRIDVERDILMSMDAQLVFDDDGKCWPRVGKYYAPTLTLTRNRDIVAMESIEAQDGESETQGVIVRYTDPTAKYTPQPSAAWLNPNYYVEGEAATFAVIDCLTISNHNQAMRIAKAMGMRMQPVYKIVPTTGLRGLKACRERIVDLLYDNTFAGVHEICTQVEVDEAGALCRMGLVPVDANRWSISSDEEESKPIVNGTTAPAVVPALPSGVTFSIFTVAPGSNQLRATFTPPTRADVIYEFQYLRTIDLGPSAIWRDMTVQTADGVAFGATDVQLDIGQSARYRAVSSSGLASAWSATVNIGILTNVDPITDLEVFIDNGYTNDLYWDSNVQFDTDVSWLGDSGHRPVVRWRNPTDARFHHSALYRNTVNNFVGATTIAPTLIGGLGQQVAYGDTVTTGTYYYWVTAFNANGDPGNRIGPVSIVL